MALLNGTSLGPYVIHSPIGAGGMGEVYRARDEKLDRQVAIKVLPEAMMRDPERVARFEREAKLLASLNHTNIAAIYGFDDAEGGRFLVMEYVDGESMAQRLTRGALPVEDALDVARQMAEALEAAHERGIVHRDLKPGNVMLAADGTVKVLDFGLAKAIAEDSDTTEMARATSPTITADYTRPGVVLGTAAYMSPEQARGKPLDKRTDIWSFGCVFFEMLTGKRTFEGQTNSDVIARILERDPDMSLLPPNTPPKIIELIRRCLQKPHRRRLRDIGDAVLELDEAISARSWTTSAIMAASGPMHAGPRRRALITWILLIGIGILTGWLGSSLLNTERAASTHGTPKRLVSRVSIVIPEFIRANSVAISPGGRLLAAIGKNAASGASSSATQIFTRSFDEPLFRPINGTSGATRFCFSPDGEWLAFTTMPDRLEGSFVLSKTAVDGSTAALPLTTIGTEWKSDSLGPRHFFWTRSGEILLADVTKTERKFLRISSQTGATNISESTNVDDRISYIMPFSEIPGRNIPLYNVNRYAGGAWQMGVAASVGKDGPFHTLTADGSYGTVTSTGHLLFTRGQRLLAVPFDVEQLKATGGPVAMIDGLRTTASWENGNYALADCGTLVFLPGGRIGTQRRLTVVNSDGTLTDLSDQGRALEVSVAASRDGKRAVVVIPNAAGLYELWITDLDVPRLRRFAANADGDCDSAFWNSTGDYVYYKFGGGREREGIYRKRADGGGDAELVFLAKAQGSLIPMAVSADESLLIVQRIHEGNSSLHVLRPNEADGQQGELETLLGATCDTAGADLSPDGNWLIYGSNESGRNELYLCSFNADGDIGRPIPVTTDGGKYPRWSPDGKLIYYWHAQKIVALEVNTTEGTPASAGRIVVDLDALPVASDDFSTLPDGRLLMMRKGPDEAEPAHVEVVLNWYEELKARVPTGVRP